MPAPGGKDEGMAAQKGGWQDARRSRYMDEEAAVYCVTALALAPKPAAQS